MGNRFDTLWIQQVGGKLINEAAPEERELLLWANEQGYIVLPKAPSGTYAYTDKHLETAQIWKDKVGDNATT